MRSVFIYLRNKIQKNFLNQEHRENSGLLTSYFLHPLLKILVLTDFGCKVFNTLGCQRKNRIFFYLV